MQEQPGKAKLSEYREVFREIPASKPTLTPPGVDENDSRNNNELFLSNPHFMFSLQGCPNARDGGTGNCAELCRVHSRFFCAVLDKESNGSVCSAPVPHLEFHSHF